MFRFTLGVVVGAVIARPLAKIAGPIVLPFVFEKATDGLATVFEGISKAAYYAAEKLERYDDRGSRS